MEKNIFLLPTDNNKASKILYNKKPLLPFGGRGYN
jgi:hypothetical protein